MVYVFEISLPLYLEQFLPLVHAQGDSLMYQERLTMVISETLAVYKRVLQNIVTGTYANDLQSQLDLLLICSEVSIELRYFQTPMFILFFSCIWFR